MDKILKYEKKFLIIYAHMLFIAILHYILSLHSPKVQELYPHGLVVLIIILGANIILYQHKFMRKKHIFVFIKVLYLLILGFYLKHVNYYVAMASFLFYIIICFQLLLVTSYKNKHYKLLFYLLTFLPAIIWAIVSNKQQFLSGDVFLFFIASIFGLIGMYKVIDENKKELEEKIYQQTILLDENEKANEELRIAQQKVQGVYEQIALQKDEMEQTNNRLNKINAEMYIQNELLRYISSTLELKQLMDLVTDSIIGAIGVDTCALIIHDDEVDQYYFKAKSNYNADVEKILKDCFKKGELKPYLSKVTPHIDSTVDENKYPFIKDRPVGSLLLFPLVRNNQVYGLLISEHASSGIFDERNLQFFQSIATQINIAVNNAHLYSRMEDLAKKDGLTGLYNRSYMQDKFNNLFQTIKKENRIISVALFDIDKFKKINDTYGHLFGDEAIKMTARIAEEFATKNGGFTGRYGGEEFVVVLPDVPFDRAVEIIHEMHERIKNEPLFYGEEIIHINVSIGITFYPEFGKSSEDLINRADNAMYCAKEHGRGRIKIDSHSIND